MEGKRVLDNLKRVLKSVDWWPIIGILITATVGLFLSIIFTSAIPLTVLVVIWWVLGYNEIATNERGVKTFFSYPYGTIESGLRWIAFLLGAILRYPTGIYTLDFKKQAGIVTRSGKAKDERGNLLQNGRSYGPVTVDADITMIFEFPKGDALIKAAKLLPDPRDKDAYIDLFEEPVLDQVRTVCGDEVWLNLVQRRAHLAQKVLDSIQRDPDGVVGKLIRESGLANVKIAIKHLQFPDDFRAAISAQEREELSRLGVETKARGERKKRVLEGQGTAIAKRNLLSVIREHPENMRGQALLTLIDMAQGPATTIFPFSTDLLSELGRVVQRGGFEGDDNAANLWKLLTNEQRQKLLQTASEMLNPKTGGDR